MFLSKIDPLEYESRLFGYKTDEKYYLDFDSFNNCIHLLLNNEIIEYHPEFLKMRLRKLKKEVIENSKFILDGVDLNVYYMSEKDFGIYTWNVQDYEKNMIKHAKIKNVFKLPVCYGNQDCLEFHLTIPYYDIPTLFKGISLTTYSSDASYIHEIGHALMQRKKKNIENYYHGEFIPTLLEQLYMYHNYGLAGVDQVTLLALTDSKMGLKSLCFDNYKTEVRKSHLVSRLLAILATDRYIALSATEKQEMLNQLKSVLNCDLVLERFLENYQINFESDDIVKSLENRLKRLKI